MHTITILQAGGHRQIQIAETGDITIRHGLASATAANAPRAAVKRFEILPGGEEVLDHQTGLIWTRATIAQKVDHDDATNAAEACDIGCQRWRLPTRAELLTLVDDTRHKPAIDTEAFPDTKNDWYWSSTPTAWSASAAWLVLFSYGYAYHLDRDDLACVRAVRVAAPSASGQ